MSLIIHVDGGARGNPGPAGAGVVIRDEDGALIHEAGYFLGRQTNNAAEYHALIRALERAGCCGPQPITIHSDSELLVRQLTGAYRVKSPKLAPLHRQAQMLLVRVGHWSVRHIRREQNARADELANLAMDAQRDVLVFDLEEQAGPAEAAAGKPTAKKPVRQGGSGGTAGLPAREASMTALPGSTPQAVRVSVARGPRAGSCPAGGFAEDGFTIGSTLPIGLCVHAAHTLVPTLLGMLNTEPAEFAAIPTLTVRCARPGCGAEFKLSPVRSSNGKQRPDQS